MIWDTERGVKSLEEYTAAIRFMRDAGKITRLEWMNFKRRMWAAKDAKELEAIYAEAKGTKPQEVYEGRRKPRHGIKVRCVETGVVYKSLSDAAADNKTDPGSMWYALNRRLSPLNGRHFEYAEGL